MQEKILRFWITQKKILILCLVAVFLWGLAAHGYTMVNFQLSHDSLDGLYAAGRENAHKIELGRVLAPAYRYLFRGMFAMPWLTGLMAFLWIGLGVWMMVSVLEIQSRFQIILVSGIMTVNLTVTALAGTFIHDLDQDMFAMMMACLSALLWQKRPRGWLVWGSLASAVCLGLYQSFISVTIALVMMVLLMQLLRGEKISVAVRRGMEGAAMVLAGSALFFLMTKGITFATGVPLASRNNSLSALGNFRLSAVPRLLIGLYQNWWEYFSAMPNTWLVPQAAPLINAVLFLFAAAVLIAGTLVRKDLSLMQKALIIAIALLLPLGMNVCYLLTSGFIHHLMQYAFVLFYVLCLLLAAHLCEGKIKEHWGQLTQRACCALLVLILWSGVQTANVYHFKKTSSTLATNARMTNVYGDMLNAGYIPGETPLVIDGKLPIDIPDGFEEVARIWAGSTHYTITDDRKSLRAYFEYVLGDKAAFCPDNQWDELVADPFVQSMPCYPYDGYIDFADDVMIVNLS